MIVDFAILERDYPKGDYLKVLVEPSHSLSERGLFCKANHRLRDIGTNREAMLDAAEQVNLVGLARLGQDLFRLVTLFRREDRVGLCVISVSPSKFIKSAAPAKQKTQTYQPQQWKEGP